MAIKKKKPEKNPHKKPKKGRKALIDSVPSLPVKKEQKDKVTEFIDLLAEAGDKKKVPEKKPPPDPEAVERGDRPMSILDHLDEFRSRLLTCLVAIMVITVLCFYFSDELLKIIFQPFNDTGQKLNIFSIAGGFMIRIKAAFWMSLMISIPLIVYQVWQFIVPAITRKDRWFSRTSILAAVMLFYAGAAFSLFFIIPSSVQIFLGFIGKDMQSTIGAEDYLSFLLVMTLAMAMVCELPVIILVLTRLGIITPQFLITKRKYAIVIIWIMAAVITPQPDPLSQSMVAVPLMILYEISVVISKFVLFRKKKREVEGYT